MASNLAAYLDSKGAPLRVTSAPLPRPGPDDLVIANRAIAINPVEVFQQATGAMIKSWPGIIGSDVAGEVHEVGSRVTRFKKGDRVTGHAWGIKTGDAAGGAFQLFTTVPAGRAATVPDKIPFTDAAVLPVAIDTAVAALFQDVEGSPRLPWPSSADASSATGKVIVVYGGSSSVGSAAIQLAAAAGVRVIAVASMKNHDLCRKCGASDTFDYKSATLTDDVARAIGLDSFEGIFDSISTAETFKLDLAILQKLGGGVLAATHSTPENLPTNVKARCALGLGESSFLVWEDFVGQALASGKLQCLPEPLVVGKGLDFLQPALDKLKSGVSAQKVVVEL